MYLIVSEYFMLFRSCSILITWLLHWKWHKSGKGWGWGLEFVERIAFFSQKQILISIIPCHPWSGDNFTPKLEAHWRKNHLLYFTCCSQHSSCIEDMLYRQIKLLLLLLLLSPSSPRQSHSKTKFSFRGQINFFSC